MPWCGGCVLVLGELYRLLTTTVLYLFLQDKTRQEEELRRL